MKKSEILRGAKQYIEERRREYVCIAISVFCRDNLKSYDHEQALELRDWIRELLDEYTTLSGWLSAYHPSWKGDIKELRLRWVDWMIAYWEERGD